MKKNLLNTIILFFLCVSVLLLIYTHYKSYFIFENKRFSNYMIYYIFTSSGILFFSIILFLKDAFKANIILLLSTFIFIGYLSEIFLITFQKTDISDIDKNKEIRLKRAKLIKEKYNIDVEARSPLEFQRDKKKDGIDLSLLITPYRMIHTEGITNFSWEEDNAQPKRFFPLSGRSNRLTVGGLETGKYNIYKTDRYGFNNPDEEWDNKTDIVVIGDSAIHAAYLPWENGWAGNIKKLTNKSSLSLGIGNNGPIINLGTLKEYAKEIKPKIVMWVYVEDNDLLELKSEIHSKILSQYLNKNFTQNLFKNQNLINKNYDLFVRHEMKGVGGSLNQSAFNIEDQNRNKIVSFLKMIELRNFLFRDIMSILQGTVTKNDLENLKKVIIEAKETTENFGGKFYFVYLPATTRWVDFDYPLKKNNYFRENVLEIANNANVDIIDLWELYFRDLKDPLSSLSFRMHSHYNQKTLENLTKILVEFINKNN